MHLLFLLLSTVSEQDLAHVPHVQQDIWDNYTKYFIFTLSPSSALVPKKKKKHSLTGRGAALKCVQDLDNTVMTQSKTEPSAPRSQEAMRLMSCDNL